MSCLVVSRAMLAPCAHLARRRHSTSWNMFLTSSRCLRQGNPAWRPYTRARGATRLRPNHNNHQAGTGPPHYSVQSTPLAAAQPSPLCPRAAQATRQGLSPKALPFTVAGGRCPHSMAPGTCLMAGAQHIDNKSGGQQGHHMYSRSACRRLRGPPGVMPTCATLCHATHCPCNTLTRCLASQK